MEQLEQRLDSDRPPMVDPNVKPDHSDGVAGWYGPPFNYSDPGSVNGRALPLGSSADIDED